MLEADRNPAGGDLDLLAQFDRDKAGGFDRRSRTPRLLAAADENADFMRRHVVVATAPA